ncbi:hypothetical protein [Tenacibaculum ovolyticum]|uniref:hypothetical protein n=1 Tax=Tenacibaculum ovolyticum TaxID=104270 RepID=UPI000426EFFA|nr:hypothetical protein [Tenacibaculum ovolyticum]
MFATSNLVNAGNNLKESEEISCFTHAFEAVEAVESLGDRGYRMKILIMFLGICSVNVLMLHSRK